MKQDLLTQFALAGLHSERRVVPNVTLQTPLHLYTADDSVFVDVTT